MELYPCPAWIYGSRTVRYYKPLFARNRLWTIGTNSSFGDIFCRKIHYSQEEKTNVCLMVERERIILGIDPGTTVMGYGILRVVGKKAEFVTLGIINLRAIKDHYLTLRKISEEVTK